MMHMKLGIFGRFVLLSIIVFFAIGVFLSSLVEPTMTTFILRQQELNSVVFTSRLAAEFLHAEDFVSPATEENIVHLNNFSKSLQMPGLFRVKLWRPDGTIVYSDKRELIGQKFPFTEGFKQALNLRAHVEIETFDANNAHYFSEAPFGEMIETYTPITFGASPEVVGIFEAYTRAGFLQQEIQALKKQFVIRIVASLLFMFAVLSLIVWRASRTVDRQAQELRGYAATLEQKVAERSQELSVEKARLIASIDSMPLGFLIANKDDRVLLRNRILTELFRLDDKKETVLEDIAKHMDKNFDLKAKTEECMKEGKICEMKEILFESKFLRGIIAPIIVGDDSQGTIGYVLLFEDITKAKVLEQSRDDFFAMASHELRTPLTAIRGKAEMFQDLYKGKMVDDNMPEMIADVYRISKRLLAVVGDFLDVSKLEQGSLVIQDTQFDIAPPIEEVMRDLKTHALEKGLSFTFKKPNGLPQVFGDRDRIIQVIMNLLGNAVKFSLQKENGVIAIEALVENKFVKVLVSDTGIGVLPKDQPLLFHKFQQVGRNPVTGKLTRGTGLGLYISKILIEKMGGTLGLEKSVFGVGSTFYFTLPIAP